MPAVRDPYKALGVDKKASADEIKKAYRKLARQYHPDKNPGDKQAEERFKEIQEAYSILSDPEKRKQYDQGGIFGFDPGSFRPGAGRLRRASATSSPTSSAAAPAARPPERATAPSAAATSRPRSTSRSTRRCEGAQVPVTVPLAAPCPTCRGTGAKPGTTPTVCSACQGRGVEAESQGLFSISQPCHVCGGTGTEIKDPCPTCNGSGQTRQVKRYKVNIPAGVRDGSRVRLAGKGEAGRRGGPPGDLYVITRVAESPIFKRKGDNLEVDVPITIVEAIKGATVEVPTLSGSKRIRVPAGTQHGTVQRLRGEGPPRLGGKGRGDIHYRLWSRCRARSRRSRARSWTSSSR